MPRYAISPTAAKDIESILAWTHEHFGEQARLRYEALLIRAIMDVAEEPDRAGSHRRPELAPDAQSYHLSLSRNRVSRAADRVARPRHCLLYRVRAAGEIEIARVLHDSMDFERHIPDKPQGPAMP
jgi:toxin ParE1/3/4